MEENSDIFMRCLICGAEIEKTETDLWGHMQLDHEEVFEEIQNWDTPEMLAEYYEEV